MSPESSQRLGGLRPGLRTLVVCVIGACAAAALAAGLIATVVPLNLPIPRLLAAGVVVALLGALFAVPRWSLPAALVSVVFIGLLRRLLGGSSGYVDNDPLIALPLVLALPGLIRFLRFRRRATTPVWLGCLLLALIVVEAVLALFRMGGLDTIRSTAFQVAPLLLGLSLAARRDRNVVRSVLVTLKFATPVAAAYGVVQYFAPAPWDLAWLASRAAYANSFGSPEPGMFRLFGPSPSPLAFATLLGVGVLVWAFEPTRTAIRLPIIGLLIVPLLLTSIRTAVFAVIVAVLVSPLALGRRPALGRLLAGGLGVVVSLVAVTQVKPDILDRFELGGIGSDESFLARSSLLATNFFTSVLSLGRGPGSAGAGGATVDNGFLAAFIELGLLGGILWILVPTSLLVMSRGPGGDDVLLQAWAVTFFYLLSEVSAPIMQGEQGLVFWPCAGALVALRYAASSRPVGPAPPAASGNLARHHAPPG